MQKSIHSDDYRHFLEELKSARLSVDFSQNRLAEALGEHQSLISKVEGGSRRLDVIELRQWLQALGVTFPDFCSQLDARLARHSRPTMKRKL